MSKSDKRSEPEVLSEIYRRASDQLEKKGDATGQVLGRFLKKTAGM